MSVAMRTWLERLVPNAAHTSSAIRRKALSKNVDVILGALATKKATPVSLRDLYRYGQDSSLRLHHAQFLHREVPIRVSQRVMELRCLPFRLSESHGIREVIDNYTSYVLDLLTMDPPSNSDDLEMFQRYMQYLLQDNTEVVQTMALGVIQAKRDIDTKEHNDFRRLVDLVLVRFFTARIGLRFIIEQFVSSAEYNPGFAGVIESFCNPVLIAQRAAEDASQLCRQHKDCSPRVLFHTPTQSFSDDLHFTYIPHHLHYMLTEILKNSMRATVEAHSPKVGFDGAAMPPIKVVFVAGNEDITIKVIDEGGGIPRSEIKPIWNFFHSTADAPSSVGAGSSEDMGHWFDVLHEKKRQEEGAGPSIPPSALAGYGVGLPLSRLFARYFGGDITITSMEGFGTDAYLHIPRLGSNCESLPAPVQESPGELDSTYVPYPGYTAY
eukprot:CAMPEP_0114524024 /NCGR_PEP_ID=MMETSP0109-20121206/21617_1 /TAXON_ID=29199 /ORGANISM="Chlorarachnion reptans, Strain CCCM449" /LENGTH=437 /DNA_ID=CAMNT_0001705405 /DNA_START=239 /DNA_END=1552 /DNA_ORIENTATION=-